MPIYHIVLLPEKKQREHLNKLKNKLYTWWYRYSKKPSSSDVHVSLVQVSFDNKQIIDDLKKQLIDLAKNYKNISLSYTEITDKINKNIEDKELSKNYPNWRWRVSFLFNNKNNKLWSITENCMKISDQLGINDMNSYIERIKIVKPKNKWTDNVLDYTANHMNICNYALPEKTKEAKSIILKDSTKEFTFEILALRNKNWKHEFEINLNK